MGDTETEDPQNPKCCRCDECVPVQGDYIKCQHCLRVYHFMCAGISERTYQSKGVEGRKQWKCPLFCRTKVAVNLQTPLPSPTPDDEVQKTEPLDKQITLATIQATIQAAIVNSQKAVEKQISDLKNSVQFMSAQYDALFKELQEEKKKSSVKIAHLERENSELREQFNDLDQYGRNRNLEILGVEETVNENLVAKLEEVAKVLEVSYETGDIDIVHRIPSKKKPSPIIVQFLSRRKRNEWLEKKKKLDQQDNKIYINEQLTKRNKEIFYHARKVSKENGFLKPWAVGGKIFMRVSETSPRLTVKNMAHIENIRIQHGKPKTPFSPTYN